MHVLALVLAAYGSPTPAALVQPPQSASETIYVDPLIRASCASYSPAERLCGDGGIAAYRTLAAGAAAARPGATVIIRQGVYSEPLAPPRSGTADAPISFRSAANEAAVITGIDAPALQLIGREHIVIDGLSVTDVTGWGRLEDAAFNVIRNMTFTRATAGGTTGGLKLVRASANRITDNRFEDGNDNLLLQDNSSGNLVLNNTFTMARHALLSVRCAGANVIRGNTFDNPIQKAIEIFDCEGVSDAPVRLNATKVNVIEGNTFVRTRESGRPYAYNAIQHGGQGTIVRRNVFRSSLGGAVNYQYYEQESLFVSSNRLYHNTFYQNRCFAIVGVEADSKQYFDNRAVNNLLYRNYDCAGGGDQVSIANPRTVVLVSNAIESRDPGFVDERQGNLRLAAGSALIDRAAPLTTARTAGSGTALPVADPLFFFDGFRIPGEAGDEIQLLGSAERARVVGIDYASRTLNLDRALTWRAGQGIGLAYSGAAPDFGAFEFDSGAP